VELPRSFTDESLVRHFTCQPQGVVSFGDGPFVEDSIKDFLVFVEEWKSGTAKERILKYSPMSITAYSLSLPEGSLHSALEDLVSSRLRTRITDATFGQRTITRLESIDLTSDQVMELLGDWVETA
jgi:hypothetical protein